MKNIVFDMGNVLLAYQPQNFISQYTSNKAHQDEILKHVFQDQVWLDLDMGIVSKDEAIQIMKSKVSKELHPLIDEVMATWYNGLIEIEGMKELLYEIRDKGYATYLLSNTSLDFYLYYKKLEHFTKFDGLYISADHKMLKPDPEIFKHFCSQFKLEANECFFIDDSVDNVNSARSIGMEACVFDGNVEKLKKALIEAGVSLS